MGEKKQLKLWLQEDKIAEVEGVALDWGYKNANAVIEKLIDSYLDFFVEAEKARRAELIRQRQSLKGIQQPERRKAG